MSNEFSSQKILSIAAIDFPHQYQSTLKDCGPACIKMIAEYYGQDHSLSSLANLCKVDANGTSLYNLSEALNALGFKTVSLKLTWEELAFIPLPCIVHWKGNHFIILYSMSEINVSVSDPAAGLKTYTIDEFKQGWLNTNSKWAILAIEPM